MTLWQKVWRYSSFKKDADNIIVLGYDILPHFLLGMVKAFIMLAYPGMFDNIIGSTETVVIVSCMATYIYHERPNAVFTGPVIYMKQ